MTIALLRGEIGCYFNRCCDEDAYRLDEKRRDCV